VPEQHLLIVEPDRSLAGWLAQVAQAADFSVSLAFDAATGQTVAATAPFDLVAVDANLPGSGGRSFLALIRDRAAGRPVAGLQMIPGEVAAQISRECFFGLDDFIIKPVKQEEFVQRLRRLSLRLQNLPEVISDLGQYAGRFRAHATARRERVTAMFADVRGFTSISESRDPETVAATVNSLLDCLAAGVLRFGGIIDKFLGDGMMAVFGLDERSADHELAAMYAAQEIMETSREAYGATLFAGVQLGLGIGLHTGDAVVGPVGPAFRRDITALGDTINTASRLCGEAPAGEIIVSERTMSAIEDRVEVLAISDVMLKGKRKMQRVYSVQLR